MKTPGIGNRKRKFQTLVGKTKLKREMFVNELNECLKNVKRFAGSYAVGELRDIELKFFPTFLVVKLDKRDSSRSHWIAFAIYVNNVFICNSFGDVKPDNKLPVEFINFMNLISKNRELYITKQLQPDISDKCGGYCVLFIKQMAETNSFCQFISLFTLDKMQNDQIVSFLTKSY